MTLLHTNAHLIPGSHCNTETPSNLWENVWAIHTQHEAIYSLHRIDCISFIYLREEKKCFKFLDPKCHRGNIRIIYGFNPMSESPKGKITKLLKIRQINLSDNCCNCQPRHNSEFQFAHFHTRILDLKLRMAVWGLETQEMRLAED